MSDVPPLGPPGPGYWQASDGNWYPPERHPNYVAPGPGGVSGSDGGPPQYVPSGDDGGNRNTVIMAIAGGVVVLALIAAGVVWFVNRGDDTVQISSGDTTTTSSKRDRSTTTTSDRRTGRSSIQGDATGTDVEVVANALEDIEDFWTRTMPDTLGKEYEPISGGFFASSPDDELPPCATARDEIDGNAFYCADRDVVAWDDTTFIPGLVSDYGELAAAVVIAHEVGHAIQARLDMSGLTVTLEHQADCYAGSWLADVQDGNSTHFTVDVDTLDSATAGFLSLADTPGVAKEDPAAHGNAFDRISGFQDGIANGASRCGEYEDDNPAVTELPFTDADLQGESAGNLSAADILELTPLDLENFWEIAYPNTFDTPWTPLSTPIGFDSTTGTPTCGGTDPSPSKLFYCVDDSFVGYDVDLMATLVSEIGDFAAAVLLATQWGLAVEVQSETSGVDTATQNQIADCYAGAWSASVFKADRLDLGGSLSLSPGDLDEAVTALLVIAKASGAKGQSSGFDRVAAFRAGVINGTTACVSIG